MNERGYIVATELRSIRIVKDIVRPLIGVDEAERAQVMALLRKWEEKFEGQLDSLMVD